MNCRQWACRDTKRRLRSRCEFYLNRESRAGFRQFASSASFQTDSVTLPWLRPRCSRRAWSSHSTHGRRSRPIPFPAARRTALKRRGRADVRTGAVHGPYRSRTGERRMKPWRADSRARADIWFSSSAALNASDICKKRRKETFPSDNTPMPADKQTGRRSRLTWKSISRARRISRLDVRCVVFAFAHR